jgi:hypothetical protein
MMDSGHFCISNASSIQIELSMAVFIDFPGLGVREKTGGLERKY